MRFRAWVSISRNSSLSSTRRMESIRDPCAPGGSRRSTSVGDRAGHARLARLFLHVVQLLLGLVQFLLLGVELGVVFAVLLGPVALVAQSVAGVGVVGGSAQTIFALQQVEFALQQRNLLLLVGEALLPLLEGGIALLGRAFLVFVRLLLVLGGLVTCGGVATVGGFGVVRRRRLPGH